MKRLQDSEFFRFLVVGGLAALVNFLSRLFFSEWMSFRYAVVVAYIVGMLTAFTLSKLHVFEASGKHPGNELLFFTIVNLVAVIQVWLISVGLAEYLFPGIAFTFYPEEVAHLIGLSIPVITSYYGHKYLSFAKARVG
ncbi:MAG: GtrA family protein [Thioalkalispiraceae bacterium]|jgi:putative flippase GtrA